MWGSGGRCASSQWRRYLTFFNSVLKSKRRRKLFSLPFSPALRPDACWFRVSPSDSQAASAWYRCRDEHREAQPARPRSPPSQEETERIKKKKEWVPKCRCRWKEKVLSAPLPFRFVLHWPACILLRNHGDASSACRYPSRLFCTGLLIIFFCSSHSHRKAVFFFLFLKCYV